MKVCKAKARTGLRCKRPAVEGREVCRFHGGLSLAGPAHPSYKGGRRADGKPSLSRYVPERYAAAVRAAMVDPELISNRHEMALCSARMDELLRDMAEGGSAEMWRRCSQILGRRREAREAAAALRAAGDEDGMRERLREVSQLDAELEDAVLSGSTAYETWRNDVLPAMEQKRKLSDSEQRRIERERQYLTTQDAVKLLTECGQIVIEALRAHVTDQRDSRMATSAILIKLRLLLERTHGLTDGSGPELDAEE